MSRENEFLKVKEIIKEYIEEARCGIFNTRNLVGDIMVNIYAGEFFIVDICYYYEYFEVFGTTYTEFKELEKYYNELNGK